MRRIGKIVNLGAERSGVSQKTGEPWARKQVVMEWMEETHNGDPFKQSVVIEVRGKVNENRCKEAMFKNEDVEFSFFMEHNDYQGKYYNNVNGSLPKEFMA